MNPPSIPRKSKKKQTKAVTVATHMYCSEFFSFETQFEAAVSPEQLPIELATLWCWVYWIIKTAHKWPIVVRNRKGIRMLLVEPMMLC